MAFEAYFHFIFPVCMLFLCSSTQGCKFYVGGKDGWVENPKENYNHWAGRNRFQVNDTLVFKLKKGEDSALLVTKDNYNTCNISSPIKSLTDDESVYKFTRSGPHYFISGNPAHCTMGQKIIVVVLAIRPKTTTPPPSPPTPVLSPPPASPSPSSPSGTVSPSPSPGPSAKDGAPPSEGKNSNSGGVLKSSLMGVVLSVVLGLLSVMV
ncbi:hypothetical protein vseg_018270 [Gypsophila vaccaria]